jgi:HlyD family secretion protein
VARIDPSVQNGTRTVDVTLTGDLPKGRVPDLSVDGTIELERLNDVLFMGRPAFGQDQSVVGLFKISPTARTPSAPRSSSDELGQHHRSTVWSESRGSGDFV